jgi:hypothetical protein
MGGVGSGLHSHTDRALLELSGGPAPYPPSNRHPDKLLHVSFWHTQYVDYVKELHWETGCSLRILTLIQANYFEVNVVCDPYYIFDILWN